MLLHTLEANIVRVKTLICAPFLFLNYFEFLHVSIELLFNILYNTG